VRANPELFSTPRDYYNRVVSSFPLPCKRETSFFYYLPKSRKLFLFVDVCKRLLSSADQILFIRATSEIRFPFFSLLRASLVLALPCLLSGRHAFTSQVHMPLQALLLRVLKMMCTIPSYFFF